MDAERQYEGHVDVRAEMDLRGYLCVGVRVRYHDGRETSWSSIRLTPDAAAEFAAKVNACAVKVRRADECLGEFGSIPTEGSDHD